jgi:formamidopyrimidine-DNA glycosylase
MAAPEMPELPEVEFARRCLVRWFDGHTLHHAEADPAARTFRGAKPADFEALRGALVRADRRGKYLMLAFANGGGLIGHLGMTGKLVRRPPGLAVPYSRARLVLDSGDVIHFRDPRLFGRLEPLPARELDTHPTLRALGRDPLVDGLTTEQLQQALGSSRQALKVALMDQGRLAGLGNIHAAEALFRARLHPARAPASLSFDEWQRLQLGIMASLDFALAAAPVGDELTYVEEPGAANPFLIYGREGSPCGVCGTPVEAFTQAGRTTHVCPTCQPAASARRPKKPPTKRSAKRSRSTR